VVQARWRATRPCERPAGREAVVQASGNGGVLEGVLSTREGVNVEEIVRGDTRYRATMDSSAARDWIVAHWLRSAPTLSVT